MSAKHPAEGEPPSNTANKMTTGAMKKRKVVSQSVYNLNPRLDTLDRDFLYHLGLDTDMDLPAMFGDVKFVCMGGSAPRMLEFARTAMKELNLESLVPVGCDLVPIGKNERYSLYKIGPIIAVNHGMGQPSMVILLHEITKLMFYAHAQDFVFIRVGTSGGIGLAPGTVVITDTAYNAILKPYHQACVLGKEVRYPTTLHAGLGKLIYEARGDIKAVIGGTLSADDFYEAQGRTDGAVCEFSDEERKEFVEKIHETGIKNLEMECAAFAAL